MVYFGAAVSHSALLGVAVGFLLGVSLSLGVLVLCLSLGIGLALVERQRLLPIDTVLGVLAHVTLAAGLILIAFLEQLRIDLMGYLFGDILAIGAADLAVILGVLVIGLTILVWQWDDLLSLTVNEELAIIEGVHAGRVRLTFVLLLAAVIATGMKVVGMLLVLALLVIPAAAARALSTTAEGMAVGAAGIGAASVVVGLFGSLQWDIPSGPGIVIVATVAFALALVLRRVGLALRRGGPRGGSISVGKG